MYEESKKAIYGTLEASLLFQEKLSKRWQEMGYQINEYNWCITNNIIDNKKCIVLWHINVLKASQIDPAIVSSVLDEINTEYGKICENDYHAGKSA